MRDSANLAWKLHLALSGLAGVHVLDSYQAERLEHGASYVHGSLGTLLMSTVDDPQEAADRDEFIVAEGAVTFEADPLPDGILRRDAAGAPAKGAGTLAPQGRTRAEGRSVLVDDVVGYGFQLVATRPVADQLGPERLARLDALGVVRLAIGVSDQGAAPITDEGGTYAGWFAEHDAAAFLARPDFYLFGLAGDARQTVALVDDLLEQLAVGHHHGKGG
jgi:3-(3-hydroxy-phenyl)propionate hydroxylase